MAPPEYIDIREVIYQTFVIDRLTVGYEFWSANP